MFVLRVSFRSDWYLAMFDTGIKRAKAVRQVELFVKKVVGIGSDGHFGSDCLSWADSSPCPSLL